MAKVVVIGGGPAGIGASIGARKTGAEVVMLERQSQLLGVGRIAGSMDVGGGYSLSLEVKEMGAHEINAALESICLPSKEAYRRSHGSYRITPGSGNEEMLKHAWVYDLILAEPILRRLVNNFGVETRLQSRAVDVAKENNSITKVMLDGGEWVSGDAFIDCTGVFGGQSNCVRHIGRCSMCPWLQCPTFGDRVSIAGKAGAREASLHRADGTPGVRYSGLYIYKRTLRQDLRDQLKEHGQIFVRFKGVVDWDFDEDYIRQYQTVIGNAGGDAMTSEREFRQEFGVMRFRDRGMFAGGEGWTPHTLDELRRIPGFENVVAAGPADCGILCSAGYDLCPCEPSGKVPGFDNLFVAGNKVGLGGVQPAINTGMLAGHNATLVAVGKEPVEMPDTTVMGDMLVYAQKGFDLDKGTYGKWPNPRAGEYLKWLKDHGFFPDTEERARKRVEEAGLTGFFAQKAV